MRYVRKKRKEHRGIYLLPNFLTTISLLSGFYAIVSTLDRRFYYAAVAIFVSCLFDMLDGRVARLTHSTSRFGVEYDSLSDVIAFGVAPGILVYIWALRSYGNFGWLAAFLFVACGAVRLARFNVQVETVQKKSFLGLPIPAAAGAIAASVLFYKWLGYPGTFKSLNPFISALVPFLVYALAFLMVSNVRYYSFKDMAFFKSKPFGSTLIAILFLIIILSQPALTLFVGTIGYAISGPVYTLILKLRKPAEEPTRLKERPASQDDR